MSLLTIFLLILNLLLTSCNPIPDDDLPDFTVTPIPGDVTDANLAGGLYACDGDHFTGNCVWNMPDIMKQCVLVLFGKPIDGFGHKPRSLGPDLGGHCDVFKGKECNDQTWVKTIVHPGVGTPAELPDWDMIRCYSVPKAISRLVDSRQGIVDDPQDIVNTPHLPSEPRTEPFTTDREAASADLSPTALQSY